jgi:hypothetical protein
VFVKNRQISRHNVVFHGDSDRQSLLFDLNFPMLQPSRN